MIDDAKYDALRRKITECLRIQRDTSKVVSYIDSGNTIKDIQAKQNHVVFARRGCGKTLLLYHSVENSDDSIRPIYLNCEDFKRHSFPNVLIEILDGLFLELESNLKGWFGSQKKSRTLIKKIRSDLASLKSSSDSLEESIRSVTLGESDISKNAGLTLENETINIKLGGSRNNKTRNEIERSYKRINDKLCDLNMKLPGWKRQIQEFFDISKTVKSVFLQIDDFYHLKKIEQPYIIDFIHRLCKDLPLYFKIATIRHASSLYIDREDQPIGIQERHDYQPINIDYTFENFQKTRNQNSKILNSFGKMVDLNSDEIKGLFKGEGFDRLVLAGGGVPRDTLSLFLDASNSIQEQSDKRIGKDDVRTMSLSNFQHRINELKQDSEGGEQDELMRGIYAFRKFCLDKKCSAFVISERVLQQNDSFHDLTNRLLDYRIIHNACAALTHKSQPGTTYRAYVIDIGCFANYRKQAGKFNEIDLSHKDAKEKLRSVPIFSPEDIGKDTPENIEQALLSENEGV